MLSQLPALTLLSAASLHCCVSQGANLRLPSVRQLALQSLPLLPRTALFPGPLQQAQQLQAQVLAAQAQVLAAQAQAAPAVVNAALQPPGLAALLPQQAALQPGGGAGSTQPLLGWLAWLAPSLVELLVAQVDTAALAAVAGHTALRRLLLGNNSSSASARAAPPLWPGAPSLAGSAGGGGVRGVVPPPPSPATAAPAMPPESWALLATLPKLESVKVADAGAATGECVLSMRMNCPLGSLAASS